MAETAVRTKAYVGVINGQNFELGIAERDEPGYYPMGPGYGVFDTYEEAVAKANEMNMLLWNMTPIEAAEIVSSSMRKQNARKVKSK
jgi:hypothetical protein